MKTVIKIFACTTCVAIAAAGNAMADSLEGVWKIESGRWSGVKGDVVYPGDPAEDEGAQAFRVFTDGYHVFISSFPVLSLFNTAMSRYQAQDGELKMERVVTNNPKQVAEWAWSYELHGDRLTLRMEGVEETWVKIE
jgi:hypothetical protein